MWINRILAYFEFMENAKDLWEQFEHFLKGTLIASQYMQRNSETYQNIYQNEKLHGVYNFIWFEKMTGNNNGI